MPGGYEWLIIILVLLLLFGAKKLPDMARSVGQSARVFKGEMKGLKDDEGKAKPAQDAKPADQPAPQELPTAPQQNTAQPVNEPGQAPVAQPQDRGTGTN